MINKLFFRDFVSTLKKAQSGTLSEDELLELKISETPEDIDKKYGMDLSNLIEQKANFLGYLVSKEKISITAIAILSLLILGCTTVTPLLARNLVTKAQEQSFPLEQLIILSIVLALTVVAYSLFLQHMYHKLIRLSIRIRTAISYACIKLLFNKNISISDDVDQGKFINIVMTDSTKISAFFGWIHTLWLSPLQIIVASVLLVKIVGVWALVGIALLFSSVIAASVIAKKSEVIKKNISESCDNRLNLVKYLVKCFRSIKSLNAEEKVTEHLSYSRDKETQSLTDMTKVTALLQFMFNGLIPLVLLVSILPPFIMGSTLTLGDFVATTSLFTILRPAMSFLPDTFSLFASAKVSLRRINSLTKINDSAVNKAAYTSLIGGNELRIKRGDLVVIKGKTGSGKSTALEILTKELSQKHDDIFCLSQDPWIFTGSLYENIVLNNSCNDDTLSKAVYGSGLIRDISQEFLSLDTSLEFGKDLVSGGQKRRIALTRCFASDSSLLMLDEPLSGQDSEMCDWIVNNGLLPLKGDKTIVIVSSNDKILEEANVIVDIDSFKVKSCTYAESTKKRKIETFEYITKIKHEKKEKISSTLKEQKTEKPPYTWYLKLAGSKKIIVGIILIFLLKDFTGILGSLSLAKYTSSLTPDKIFLYLFTVFALVESVISWVKIRLLLKTAIVASKKLFKRIINKITKTSVVELEKFKTEDVIDPLSKDFEVVDQLLPETWLQALNSIVSVIATVSLIIFNIPSSSVIVVLLGLVYIRIFIKFRNYVKLGKEIENKSRANFLCRLEETIDGINSFKYSSTSDYFKLKLNKSISVFNRSFFTNVTSNRYLATRMELLSSVIILLTGIAVSIISKNKLSNFNVAAISIPYALSITSTLNWLVRMLCDLESYSTSLIRLKKIDNLKEEINNHTDNVEIDYDFDKLTLNNLNIGYKEPLLRDVNLEVNRGDHIIVSGQSGLGKSTLALSISCLIPSLSGVVDLGGFNLIRMNPVNARKLVHYVGQYPFLLKGTLRENIDPDNNFSDSDIHNIFIELGGWNILNKLEHGLETIFNPESISISLGEIQFICLIRAACSSASVIIFDESTSYLDPETERIFLDKMKSTFNNKICISIAHKEAAINASQNQFVLKNKSLVKV